MQRLTPLLLGLVLAGPLAASEQVALEAQLHEDTGASLEAELSGLVIDNTISRFGYEFHRQLSMGLQDLSGMTFHLVVRERPSARWGSLVWVEYGNQILYRRFLQPNVSQIEEIARPAVTQVLEELSRLRLQALLQDTHDLERDEL
ncbi:CsgE family curli-type amyloid fiber assembly protein [Stutzerimonas tarimensis]|uniref:Curli production assembly/transport component CsgE n=1 Tax=Stutzerimonas tarimensis TaxID=1507735 RepID=A0ABV7T5H5_9GAMM